MRVTATPRRRLSFSQGRVRVGAAVRESRRRVVAPGGRVNRCRPPFADTGDRTRSPTNTRRSGSRVVNTAGPASRSPAPRMARRRQTVSTAASSSGNGRHASVCQREGSGAGCANSDTGPGRVREEAAITGVEIALRRKPFGHQQCMASQLDMEVFDHDRRQSPGRWSSRSPAAVPGSACRRPRCSARARPAGRGAAVPGRTRLAGSAPDAPHRGRGAATDRCGGDRSRRWAAAPARRHAA